MHTPEAGRADSRGGWISKLRDSSCETQFLYVSCVRCDYTQCDSKSARAPKVLADLNEPYEEKIQRLMEKCAPAIALGFLRHFRRLAPDTDGSDSWHASVGKNSGWIGWRQVHLEEVLQRYLRRHARPHFRPLQRDPVEAPILPALHRKDALIGGMSPRSRHVGD